MENELRRQQNNLYLAGMAAIAFGMWSTVKAVMHVSLDKEFHSLARQVAELNDLPLNSLYIVFFAAMAFGLFLELGFRLYVGLSAIAESRGKRKRKIYIFFTILMIFVSLLLYVNVMLEDLFNPETFFSSFMNLVIEISSLCVLAELAISAIKLRRLRSRREGD